MESDMIYQNPYEDIIQSFEQGDWEHVLKLQSSLNDPFFLWPKPRKNDLDFIAESLRKLNINTAVSIGCGTGLLEWLLKASTGLNVIGIEVDRKYWTSKYARASFIKFLFPGDDNFLDAIEGKNNAMIFCYFNNKPAFIEYLENFKGRCLVIIGPHNVNRHTDPRPFDQDIPPEWVIWKNQEIGDTGDYIVIYRKDLQ